jgi:serine protease Do
MGWQFLLGAGPLGRAALGLVAALVLPPAAWPGEPAEASLSPENIPLSKASDAVVGLVTVAVENARSNATLGPVRQGSGVVIGADGLVLTIGYLILEADQITLLTDDGRHVPARVMGYDVATGFGLVKALIPLNLPAAPLGDPNGIEDDETLVVISGGDDAGLSAARRVSRRPFSGYWEYHLDQALFTAPARSDHSGAALFNLRGELLGVGSLYVSDALGPGQPPLRGNMFVPVDLLRPILSEVLSQGRSAQSRRAWMGVNCTDVDGEVRVVRVSPDGPADDADLHPGDRIVRLDGQPIADVSTLWHALWSGGAPERNVALDILRAGTPMRLTIRTIDRQSAMKQPEGT